MKAVIKRKLNEALKAFGLQISGIPDAYNVQSKVLNAVNKRADIIFDVGAHNGRTTRRYRDLFPHSNIHAFEPFPDVYDELCRLTMEDKRVITNKLAVSESSTEENLFVNRCDTTNSLLDRPQKGRRYYPDRKGETLNQISIRTTSIDEYTTKNSISHIDILKMDIQGSELRALQGSTNLLRNGAINMIYTEVTYVPHYEGSPLLHDIWSYLNQFGYSLFNTYNNLITKDGQLKQGDAIFFSPALRLLHDKSI